MTLSRLWLPRPKYLLAAVITTMFLVVMYKDFHLLHPSPADYEHYRSFKWWLIPHGITGALALFLGPLQFSRRLRQRSGIVEQDARTSMESPSLLRLASISNTSSTRME